MSLEISDSTGKKKEALNNMILNIDRMATTSLYMLKTWIY